MKPKFGICIQGGRIVPYLWTDCVRAIAAREVYSRPPYRREDVEVVCIVDLELMEMLVDALNVTINETELWMENPMSEEEEETANGRMEWLRIAEKELEGYL